MRQLFVVSVVCFVLFVGVSSRDSISADNAASSPPTSEEVRAKYGKRFPEFRRILKTGDSEARKAVFREIDGIIRELRSRELGSPFLDESCLDCFAVCAEDPDPKVRDTVARIVGFRWVWGEKEQNDKAISLLLKLSNDPGARHNAIYYGLSVVRPKSDEVVEQLVRLAAEQYDGQIARGLRRDKERARPLLLPYLDGYKDEPERAVNAYVLHRALFGEEPPDSERFDNLGVFLVRVGPGNKNLSTEAFRNLISESIPKDVKAEIIIDKNRQQQLSGRVIVQGVAGAKSLVSSLRKAPHLSVGRNLLEPAPKHFLPHIGLNPSGQKISYDDAFQDLYTVLAEQYPAFGLKGIDWKKVGEELLPRAKRVRTDEQFGLLCMELVARLEDSHASLLKRKIEPPKPPTLQWQWDPGFACLIDDQGQPVVYHVDKNGSAKRAGVTVGMRVLSINGKPAKVAMQECMDRRSKYWGYSSKRYLQYHAARFFIRQAREDARVTLKMQYPNGRIRTFRLSANLAGRYLPRLPVPIEGIRDSGSVSWKMLDSKIGYIYVRKIRKDLIESLDRAVGELGNARGLIIDVRGNSGGGYDAGRAHRNFAFDDDQEPRRPRFTGPIALLIDARCISAGEGWASWFVAKKRARVFGTATAGASAKKRIYTLKNGLYKVRFPIRLYRGSLERPIERRGVEPDVAVQQNAQDLANGRDTVLQAAYRDLLEND